jgi:hypothetical protein
MWIKYNRKKKNTSEKCGKMTKNAKNFLKKQNKMWKTQKNRIYSQLAPNVLTPHYYLTAVVSCDTINNKAKFILY